MSINVIEDLIHILSSINKISMLAFIVTLIFLLYEIYLFKKESLQKIKPKIPEFKETKLSTPTTFTRVIVEKKEESTKKPTIAPLLIAFILMVFFGLLSLVGFLNPGVMKKEVGEKKGTARSNQGVNIIPSSGIKIYDDKWQELKNEVDFKKINIDTQIYIGVETIKEADIDKARVRVNKDNWKVEHVTSQFNKEKNVYYKEYKIGSSESKLKIEAQLHSISDGWLGD